MIFNSKALHLTLKSNYNLTFKSNEEGRVVLRWWRNDRENNFSPTNSSKDHLNAEQLPQNNFLNAGKGHQAPRKATILFKRR